MNHRKHGARLLGLLFVAALGVMAFAASAQAVVPGFLINKAAFGALTLVEGVQEKPGTMLVPGLNFQLTCETLSTDKGEITSKTNAEAILLFTKCTTLSITKFPEEIHCHVTEPIKAEGIILPAELTNNEPAILAEKIKALIRLHLPDPALGTIPCVLPLDNIVTGEVCFAIKSGTNDTLRPLLLSNAGVACKERPTLEALTEGAGVKDVLKYGTQTVTLDGEAELFAPGGQFLGVSLY